MMTGLVFYLKTIPLMRKIKLTAITALLCVSLCPNAWPIDDTPPAMDTYNKAVRLYEAKNWDSAKDYFHQYLAEYSDTPLYVTCLYYLAYCYQQLGDKNQAVLLYHKVMDMAQGGDAFWGDMAEKRIEEVLETQS